MQSEKICRAIVNETVAMFRGEHVLVQTYTPENTTLAGGLCTNIHQDASGEMWYWTPEPEIPVDAE